MSGKFQRQKNQLVVTSTIKRKKYLNDIDVNKILVSKKVE